MKWSVAKLIAITISLFVVLATLSACQNEHVGASSVSEAQDEINHVDASSAEATQPAPKYDIKMSKLEPFKDSFAAPPSSFEDNILLTFSKKIGSSNFNTALYSDTIGEMEFLDFYAGLEFKMDKEYFYYLDNKNAGGELIFITRKSRETGTEEVIYTAPEGYALAPRLSCGDNYLVWAQYQPDKERTEGFSLWAYDIKQQQAFEVANICYGNLTYSYIINQGHIAYFDEDSSALDPYIITGYNLGTRKKAAEIAIRVVPNTIVFDGKTYLWSTKSSSKALYSSDGNDTKAIANGVGNFDIYDGEYVVASVNGDYQVISLSQDRVIFSLKEQEQLTDKERLVPFFTLNKDTGRAVINSLVKQSDNNSAAEYIYLIDFIKNDS